MTSKGNYRGLTVVLCLVALIVWVAPLTAQDRKTPEFEKTVDVNLVLLDVLVFDARGNPVRGLTADDFIIYEDGTQVDINSVDEYFLSASDMDRNAGDMLYESPPRTIIFVLDRVFSTPGSIRFAKETISDFVGNHMLPGDRGMILTFDRSMNTVQDLTTDRRRLEMAAEGIKTSSVSMSSPELSQNIQSDADMQMRLRSNDLSNNNPWSTFVDPSRNIQAQIDIRVFIEKLQLLAKSLKAIPGRKTVMLLSEGYDERLINNPTMTTFNRQARDRIEAQSSTTNLAGDVSGRFQTSSILSTYNEMFARVNDANTSFYVLDLAALTNKDRRTDDHHQQTGYQRAAFQKGRLDSLATLANSSGGKLYSGQDTAGLLQEIDQDISNYYIITFATEELRREGKFRKVRVETRDKSLKVRTREGYYEPKKFENFDNRERFLHLVEGFFQSSPTNDLKARSEMFFLPIDPKTVVGSMVVAIPAEELGAGNGEKSIEVIGSCNDRFGNRLDAFHKKYYYQDHLEDIRSEGVFRLKQPMMMESGTTRVKVIVRDNSTGRKYHTFSEYTAQGAVPEQLYMSTVLLLKEQYDVSSEEQFDLKVENLGEETGYQGYSIPDPLRVTTGRPMFPHIDFSFEQDKQPIIFFTAGNFWMDEDKGEVDFYIDYAALDDKGREIALPVVRERLLPIPGTNRVNVISQVQLSTLAAGDYKLRVRFLDQRYMQGVQRVVPLHIQ